MRGQIEVPLLLRKDRNDDEYMIGSIDVPAWINLAEVTFIAFFPPDNAEDGAREKGTLMIRPNSGRRPPARDDDYGEDPGDRRDKPRSRPITTEFTTINRR